MTNSSRTNSDLGFSTIAQLRQRLAAKSIDASELAAEFKKRILEIDQCPDGLNSVIAINTELDLAKSNDTGALSAIPILIKDNIESVGLPATAGSMALADRRVTQDAPLVTSLKHAGGLILGSTNLSEWANIRSGNSTSGWSAVGGLTANPWKFKHSAGGSSSGSGASVAAGLVPVAIGTETDGSIVCPASLNGVVGIKPTVGSVSTKGIVPISFSQDSPGPLARNVNDALTVLEVLLNKTGLVAASAEHEKLKVGVVRQWLTSNTAANDIFENQISALAAAGVDLVDITIPEITQENGEDEFLVLMAELVHTLDEYLEKRSGAGPKSLAQVVEFNLANSDLELKHFGQEYFHKAIETGGLTAQYQQARLRNLDWAKNQVLDPALEKVDVLIGVPYGPAWISDLENGDDYSSASWMTNAPSIAGYPIASIPMGFVDGLPVGLGLVAKANNEIALARALGKFEKVFQLSNLQPTFIH